MKRIATAGRWVWHHPIWPILAVAGIGFWNLIGAIGNGQTAADMGQSIYTHWSTIVAFGSSPAFPWFMAALNIILMVGVAIYLGTRDEKGRKIARSEREVMSNIITGQLLLHNQLTQDMMDHVRTEATIAKLKEIKSHFEIETDRLVDEHIRSIGSVDSHDALRTARMYRSIDDMLRSALKAAGRPEDHLDQVLKPVRAQIDGASPDPRAVGLAPGDLEKHKTYVAFKQNGVREVERTIEEAERKSSLLLDRIMRPKN